MIPTEMKKTACRFSRDQLPLVSDYLSRDGAGFGRNR